MPSFHQFETCKCGSKVTNGRLKEDIAIKNDRWDNLIG